MKTAFQRRPSKIRYVQLHRRQPIVSIEDLALMLEVDLSFGRRDDFRRRLQKALDSAHQQGLKPPR